MKRFFKYELIEVVEEGPITTYSATEIASGRPVLFHMLTNTLDVAVRDEIIQKAQSLKGAANGESGIVDAGEYIGFRYVVTEVLEEFMNLRAGIVEQAAQLLVGAARAVNSAQESHSGDATSAAGPGEKPISSPALTPGSHDAAPLRSAASGPDSSSAGSGKKIDISNDETVEFKLEELSRATKGQESSTEEGDVTAPAREEPAVESGVAEKTAVWFQLARQHFQTKEFREALSALEQVLEVNPVHAEALDLRAEVRRQEEQSRHEETVTAPVTNQPQMPASPGAETGAPEDALLLLSEGQALCSAGRGDEGLEKLRRARQLDPHNALIPIVLVNSLIQHATSLGGSDWQTVETLAAEVLEIQPAHGIARGLREKAAEGKQRRIGQFHAEAQRLRSLGNIHGALAAVTEGLRQNPGDASLARLGAELEKVRDETKPATAPSPPARVTPAREQVTAAQVEARLREVAKRYSDDSEIKSLANEILDMAKPESPAHQPSAEPASPSADDFAANIVTKALREPPRAPQSYAGGVEAPLPLPPDEIPTRPDVVLPDALRETPPAPPVTESRTPKHASKPRHIKIQGSAAQAAGKFLASLRTLVSLPKKTAALGEVKAAVASRSARRKSLRLVLIAMAVLVLLLTAATTLRSLRSGGSAIATVTWPVQIQSQPPGASIAVDDTPCGISNCAVDLVSGNHVVTARLAGYLPATLSLGIDRQTPPERGPVVITLTPLTPVFRVSSSLGRGQVSLDGQPVTQFEDGEYEFDLSSLGPGQHTLRIVERDTAVTIPFEAAPGSAPLVRGAVQARNLKAVVIAAMGGQIRVYGAATGQEVRLEGNVIGKLGPEGLLLEDIAEGAHTLTVGTGQDQQTVVFDVGPQPTLAAYLGSDRNIGSLRIQTGEDGVTIYLNGEKYRRSTQRGLRLIYLPPKAYTVRVEKDGFRAAPEQTVEVRKGGEARLTFALQPNPRAASLQVRNGVAGTEVFLDGRLIGTVRPDGGLTTAGVAPGSHTIRLEKRHYKTKQLDKDFADGGIVEIDGTLESSVGTLSIQVLPAGVNARLKLRSEGQSSDEAISEATQYLAPGTYTVTASADGYEDYGATVRIAINETKTATLTLQAKEEKKQAQPALQLADWEKAGGWRSENNTLVRSGGNFVLSPGSAGPGVYVFTARALKGGSVQWVAGYTDRSNYVLYEINKNQFERTQVIRGDKKEKFRARHGLNGGGFVSVKVEVTPDAIIHKVLKGDNWVVIDTFEHASTDSGQFGFYVPGRDEIGLSFFNFFPGILQAGN